MRKCNLFFRLFLILPFSINACSANEDQSGSVPVDLLSKPISELLEQYPSSFEETTFPLDQDSSSRGMAWKFTDKHKHYFWIMDKNKDGISDIWITHDSYFESSKGIRVGDSLAKVMGAYADAEFHGDFNTPELITVYAEEGKIRFTFDTSHINLERIITSGIGFTLQDKEVLESKIWHIEYRDQSIN